MNGNLRRRRRAVSWLVPVVLGVIPALAAEPAVYEGPGGWGLVTGLAETVPPPDSTWKFEAGLWIGRIPDEARELAWDRTRLLLADALPVPAAAAVLPAVRNAFGPCLVKSLSVRYYSVVSTRRWSLVFNEEGKEPDFKPLVFPDGRKHGLVLWLEDAATGVRRELRPSRQGRDTGGRLPWQGGDARFYAGELEDGRLEWSFVVAPGPEQRWILQGQVRTVDEQPRRLRLRVGLRTGAEGAPVVQEESPPAVVGVTGDRAVALFVDLAEPRRSRAIHGEPGVLGLEFDLGVTTATGNFPGNATFSIEVGSWETDGLENARWEAAERLPRAGDSTALPAQLLAGDAAAVAVFEPARTVVAHPGGFRGADDVVNNLMLRTAGLFPDRDWAASAFQCVAQDAGGEPRIRLEGDAAIVAVNPDPDLKTMLEMGPNRGRTVLERIRRSGASAVLLRLGTLPVMVDFSRRASGLCDYPLVWEEGAEALGVDLRHAEAELMASLACTLKDSGVALVVADGGPSAPFTTYHADALACASADPAEMRRQRALAGPRPVLWLAPDPGPEAADLARNLGFVRLAENGEN